MANHYVPAPFLKWAGGKRWLVDRHADIFPEFSGRYIEPFLGGGSVFFHLSPKSGVLSDTNRDLIDCYQQIKLSHGSVKSLLERHRDLHSKEYYYLVRSEEPTCPVERAARFIYLNRTCWNGLYRVNLKGKFNVPIGDKDSVIFENEDFSIISNALNDLEILCQDFEKSIDLASDGDFIFVDPPYTVKHNFNGFIKYNENLFSWDDQIRLRNSLVRASERGASVLLTNADHASVHELYVGIGAAYHLERKSVLSGKKEARGSVHEFVVRL